MTTTSPAVDSAMPRFLDGRPKQLFIDGDWTPAASGKTFQSENPSTGEVLAELAEGDQADVDRAVAAARRAFDDGPWSRFTPMQRQRVMLKLADLIDENIAEFGLLDSMEMGAPVGLGDFGSPPSDTMRYYAGWPTKLHGETVGNSISESMFTYTLKQPVGVVAAIVPWNGPLISAMWKMGPALAAGCTMILKPAEEAGLSPLLLGELAMEAGFPPGVFNVVTGFGETAGAALSAHPDVDKIGFTGSTVTGQAIMRAAVGNLKKLTLELGGKSPDIIFADADLDAAVVGAGMGVFGNTGQMCIAGSRIYVERPIYQEFIDRLAEFAGSLRVGHSLDPQTQIGPVVSRGQLERVTGYLEIGRQEGATAVAGGARLTEGDLAKGFFVPPTVFVDAHDDMRITTEEIFGPVAAVMPFDTLEEVVARANRTQFGLGGGVWTRDIGKAHKVAKAVRAGTIWVNTYGVVDPAIPFGGMKMSGWGKDLGMQSVEDYLTVKAVWINTA
jgi:aldehyde dehydrogenase (NAD+)